MTCRPQGDAKLLQIVDAALSDVARKSGDWLLCRPGCTQCCYGPFPISQLDAARLRDGMEELQNRNPVRADRVRERAEAYIERLRNDFPGDPESGILGDDEEAEARFEDFADDEPCPALDPTTGTCDVYEFRPMTCRTFGPPVRSGPENGLGVCELCFHGATDKQIAACEMVPDPENHEVKLIAEAEKKSGVCGNTIVAYCLREPTRS
ncbi:MAG TPA: YkgJ family cysteine cluster protein [Candidatus Angelobacter sp.]|jgi:Fe-S-cluster containining protein|nr:YkgJ family cysteine cluster protein [Candidatus Angelobacter sp.]